VFYVGLDLGQLSDYTALAILETPPIADKDRLHRPLQLRHLERYPLRTPYPDLCDQVALLMREPRLSVSEFDPSRAKVVRFSPTLVVDSTGVGVAITDLLRRTGLKFVPVSITGGDTAHRVKETWRVPKRDLVASLEVPFHRGRLKVAKGLQLWPVLREELLNFRRKVDLRTSHDSYEHWRESDHDDLVLATSLASWASTRPISRVRVVDIHGRVRAL
jgi:hypothetical protein